MDLSRIWTNRRGRIDIESALLVAVIATISIIGLSYIGARVNKAFDKVNKALSSGEVTTVAIPGGK